MDRSVRGATRLLSVLCTIVAAALSTPDARIAGAERALVASPDGTIRFSAGSGAGGQLEWTATLDGRPVIDLSPLGIVVDGIDLGRGAEIQGATRYRINETYPWRGVHATAVSRSNGAKFTVRPPGSTLFTLDVRVADDAVAFRFVVPGKGHRVPDAATTFTLPQGSTVWSHGLRDHYEATYERRMADVVPAGEWAAPPMTFALPNGAGYGAITEADLRNYAGMALQADGHRGFREQLGHAHPASYPYTLRYGEANAKRLAIAAPIDGEIATPWRVVLIGRTLNALVNSDAIANLCPPPDPALFPEGIKSLPSTWDETRVLPPSAIGELALFARRSGDRWFVAAMNGPASQTVSIDLSFLGPQPYQALIVRDKLDDSSALEVETREVRRTQALNVSMHGGGGFVIRLTR